MRGVQDKRSTLSSIYSGVTLEQFTKCDKVCILSFHVPASIPNGQTLMQTSMNVAATVTTSVGNVVVTLRSSDGKVINYGVTTDMYVQLVFPTND